jgi:hypothetical protein
MKSCYRISTGLLSVFVSTIHGFVATRYLHHNLLPPRQQVGASAIDDDFLPNKPLNLPSLQPKDAGPLYNTCISNNGVEPKYPEACQNTIELDGDIEKDFVPNKPIELESMKEPLPTFFGLEPKSDELRSRDGSMTDQGIPLFTSSVILLSTCYMIYIALFTDQI